MIQSVNMNSSRKILRLFYIFFLLFLLGASTFLPTSSNKEKESIAFENDSQLKRKLEVLNSKSNFTGVHSWPKLISQLFLIFLILIPIGDALFSLHFKVKIVEKK